MNTRPTPETDAAWACFKGYMEPLQDVQDLSRKLERERDEAREQGNDMREKWLAKGQCCEYLGAELHEAINQRDRLAEILGGVKTLSEITEQRDRLAEVVNAATILIAAKGRHNTMLAYEGLRATLQSLTPNPEP